MHWNLITMLRSMSGTAAGVIILLLLMSAISFTITFNRILMYRAARRQTRLFIEQVVGPLGEGRLGEAISIAERNNKSHVAKIVGAGLAGFESASFFDSSLDMVESAKSGLERSTMVVHQELKKGLSGLATIGSTAPFAGLFGTVIGIVHVFMFQSSHQVSALSGVARGISEALITTALGLLVAVPAVWSYNYFNGQMESFDIEMKNSSKEMETYLIYRVGGRK